jgi:hypothetical protein
MASVKGRRTTTWTDACGRRLARHGLAAPAPAEHLVDQVGAICGAHAQVMAAAELSIGLRVAGTTRQDVRRALWEDRTLVKTCGPRGTIHLLPAADLPWWTGALGTAPAPNRQAPGVRLDEAQTDAVVAAIGDALLGAELTIEELDEEVVARTGAWAGERVLPAFQENRPRWQQAGQVAAWRGVLCFGPNRGRRVTHTHPATWLPGFEPASPGTSAATLVRSYLHAYGPATPAQVARWLNVPRLWVSEALAALGDQLEPVTFEGQDALEVAGDGGEVEPPRGVRLLPYFDAYAVGCHPRERVFPGAASERALIKGQAGPVPVMLIDGVVSGVWHQRRSGKRLAITVEPFGSLSRPRRRELDGQVERIGAVLEATPELTVGEVTAAPHL